MISLKSSAWKRLAIFFRIANKMTDKEKLDTIEKICNMSPADLRLRMGEMTAEEMRTVKALLGWIKRILEK